MLNIILSASNGGIRRDGALGIRAPRRPRHFGLNTISIEVKYETNLSTAQQEAQKDARVSQENGHEGREGRDQEPQEEGKEETGRHNLREVAPRAADAAAEPPRDRMGNVSADGERSSRW
jgi:hypothetical protein